MSRDVVRLLTRLESNQVVQLHELFEREWWTRRRTLGELQLMRDGTTHPACARRHRGSSDGWDRR
jgi:hypothetical protein